MPSVTVLHIDAFSTTPGKGNPAGVVLNGESWTDKQMQEIARKVGFNETAFVVPTDKADFGIRYFTPGHENDLCGHATMGTIFALYREGILSQQSFTIDTKAGILPIDAHEENGSLVITMQHAAPAFEPFAGSRAELANVIGLKEEELHEDLPIVYGSTGIWTLIVPVKSLASFSKMAPRTEAFPNVLKEMPKMAIHPICFETRDEDCTLHSRHFSSPFSGTVEDPVTGTASGVMGAYYKTYVAPDMPLPATLIMEQGHEVDKDGKVSVHIDERQGQTAISISGTAVYVKEMVVEL
ncbi:MAG: PhzF family phenazine biosynthesis isomerase [Lysinibacillus sp.]